MANREGRSKIYVLLTALAVRIAYNRGMADSVSPLSQYSNTYDLHSIVASSPGRDEFAQLLTMLLTAATQSRQLNAPTVSSSLPQLSGGLNGFDSLGLLLYLSLAEQLSRLGTPSAASNPTPTTLPVAGRLTQDFHLGHGGIDLAVPTGTPVHATMSGKVVHAGWNEEGYGYLVIVENGPMQTYYAHLKEMPAVQVGDAVTARQVLGLSGSTGNSTGPHVHYEVRVDSKPVSPREYSSALPGVEY